MTRPLKIACFISPHGYGHAARASAVMSAVHALDPGACFEIYTTVPPRFFSESLTGPHHCHHLTTDIGLTQTTPFAHDIPATVDRLDRFIPFDPEGIRVLADRVRSDGCRAVVCDISPMGIVVAQAAGVPSVLIENFTWDWIYEAYLPAQAGMGRHVAYLKRVFSQADFHIQADPVCRPVSADLRVRPISRKPRVPADDIRRRLGIPQDAEAVIATMGGIPFEQAFESLSGGGDNRYIVVPGAAKTVQTAGNIVRLPHFSDFYHPDLINACNAVVGKAGYSTLAETYFAGLPYGYAVRADFRESPVLETFIQTRMTGVRLSEKDCQNGRWTRRLGELLALPAVSRHGANGADQAGRFIYNSVIQGKKA